MSHKRERPHNPIACLASHMRAARIRKQIVKGQDVWRPDTGEYVFYDPDFDDNDTFCLTWLDDNATSENPLYGYCASCDTSVNRTEISLRMAREQTVWIKA